MAAAKAKAHATAAHGKPAETFLMTVRADIMKTRPTERPTKFDKKKKI